jgi:nucleoside-diphosphate-sugar epimerase
MITANRYFDISKAKERLGYKPIVDMKAALDQTVGFWYPKYKKE